jgi:hypothetical protein
VRRAAWAAGYAALFAYVLGVGGRGSGTGWEIVSLVVTLGFPLMLLVTLAQAIAVRKAAGPLALLPLVLLLAGLPGIGAMRAADSALYDRRFARHLAEMEALVTRAPFGSGNRVRLPVDSLPRAVRDCCARVVVRRDSVGQVSATFFGRRSTTYLYDPSGSRVLRGIWTGRWRSHERLAPDWYRVMRF